MNVFLPSLSCSHRLSGDAWWRVYVVVGFFASSSCAFPIIYSTERGESIDDGHQTACCTCFCCYWFWDSKKTYTDTHTRSRSVQQGKIVRKPLAHGPLHAHRSVRVNKSIEAKRKLPTADVRSLGNRAASGLLFRVWLPSVPMANQCRSVSVVKFIDSVLMRTPPFDFLVHAGSLCNAFGRFCTNIATMHRKLFLIITSRFASNLWYGWR